MLDGPDGPVTAYHLSDTAARMLVFLQPTDPDAADLLSRLDDWAARLGPVVLHVVVDDDSPDLAARRAERAHRPVGDPSGAARAAFGIEDRGAVLLGTDRFLAGGPARGDDEVAGLVEETIEQPGRRSGSHGRGHDAVAKRAGNRRPWAAVRPP